MRVQSLEEPFLPASEASFNFGTFMLTVRVPLCFPLACCSLNLTKDEITLE